MGITPSHHDKLTWFYFAKGEMT